MKVRSKNYNNLFDQFYVFVLVIYAGCATVFVRATDTWDNLIGLFLPILLSLFIGFWHRINISRSFVYLVLGYTIYNLFLTVKFQAIHPRFFGIYLISFFIAYITISALRFRFFIYYENILYLLCIIALIFWGIHIIIPDALTGLLNQIAFSKPGSGNVDSNIIIYTVNNLSSISNTNLNINGFSLIRNSGFAWEPGGFACYIDLAIFINLVRTKFKLFNNKKLWVLIITLITTFSTTGFSIFLLLIIFYTYNQNIKYMLLSIPVALAVSIFVLTLPFMSEKIIDVADYDTEEMIENTITYESISTPQRVESLQIDFIDFMNNPILGYGGQGTERWTAKLGANISTISGIGKVMSVFGIVGILFFFINLTNTSIELARIFRFKGWFFPFLMIVMISFSYSIIFSALLMCFWLINTNYLSKKTKLDYLIDRIRFMKYRTKTM